jgi:hypothetical protein
MHRIAITAFTLGVVLLSNSGHAQTIDVRASTVVRAAFAAKFVRGRPMEQRCDMPIPATPAFDALLAPYRDRQGKIEQGAKRFPIRRCSYDDSGFTAEVIMMNPDEDQIAAWVVNTCQKSNRVTTGVFTFERCIISAARQIWWQANAQYPISGLVVEPGVACDKATDAQWGFRHGVTVRLEGMPKSKRESLPPRACKTSPQKVPRLCTEARIDDPSVRESLLTARVIETAGPAYARLSNLARTGGGQCPRADGAQPEWLDRSRDAYLAALGQDDYPMLTQWIDTDKELLKPTNRFACQPLDATVLDQCPQ